MKRLLLVCVCGGFASSAAMAQDPYERWLTTQSLRGMQIEEIRVANEKPLAAVEETDAEVASILAEVEMLEDDSSDNAEAEDSS